MVHHWLLSTANVAWFCPGTEAAVKKTLDHLEGVGSQRLNVQHGFHSPCAANVLPEYREALEAVSMQAPSNVRFVSTVLGREVTEEITDPDYWCKHVTGTVLYQPAVEKVHDIGGKIYVEMGPGQTLSKLAKTCLAASNLQELSFLPSL